ncbi:MAG: type II secretion system major pseudopilin GspG [Hellea sp.]|nr:type II secretion system major pseudopilin GspG [Hellea sp.]
MNILRLRDQIKLLEKDEGFTLIEVLVTMAIISIMVVGVALTIIPETGKAQIIRAKSDIRTLEQGLEMYRLDMLDYPEQEMGLAALKYLPSGVDEERYRKGGYLKSLSDDPWGNPYVYIYPGENDVYDIISFGADGEVGGEAADADIVSWDK